MRVISGKFRGQRLHVVPGSGTRPTTDRMKEAIFSMILPYLDEQGMVLDLFSGTGSMAIESISRGMQHATLIDKSKAAIDTIQKNVAATKSDQFTIKQSDANKALTTFEKNFDLIFIDPPYAQQQIEKNLLKIIERKLIKAGGIIVIESAKEVELPLNIESLVQIKDKNYGISRIRVYQNTKK